MNEVELSAWEFGGPLAGVPLPTAWVILGTAVAVTAVLAWLSYRHAVRSVSVPRALALTVLRTAVVAVLLFCLANPVRIERKTLAPPEPPPSEPQRLAVVVDRSDSMTAADNRGRSRLDQALSVWRRLEKVAQTTFAETKYYSVAAEILPAASLEEAAARKSGTGDTRLFQSVATLLQAPPTSRPNAIVILTDGLDTTGASEGQLREAALAAGVPLYFIMGSNRSARPEPFLRVREWRAPPTAMRNTEFALEATFEAFSREDRKVPFSLWQGNRRIETGEVALTTGSNLVPKSFPISAGEPGVLEFTLRLGEGDAAPVVARSVTAVLARQNVRVLVYQGALDWGFRYFTDALRTDASFEFETLVNPDVRLTLIQSTRSGGTAVGQLPGDVRGLKDYDCVVLAHAYPAQLSRQQQQALVDFTRGGGSVLFLSPDPGAVPQYAGAPLAELLPVLFDRVSVDPTSVPSVATATRRMRSSGAGSQQGARENRRGAVVLAEFALTEAGRASPIFARAERGATANLVPRFLEFVPASRAKPGAEVLAVHPVSRDLDTGLPHILLAMESFGRGRAAILTTDALWRWKLSEDSQARVVETFWQQLLLTIGRRREEEHLRFTEAPMQVKIGEKAVLRLGGVKASKPPSVTAKSPNGRSVNLSVQPTANTDAPWSVEWTPDRAGEWEISAAIDSQHRAHVFPSAVAEIVGELARALPAIEPMRALAGETGGALLTHEPPVAWRPAKKDAVLEPVVNERRRLRWNNWNILATALGIYGLELILRRFWKLL